MNKWLSTALTVVGLGLVAAVVVFFLKKPLQTATPTPTPVQKEDVKIGFSLGTLREERWQKDTDLFTKRAQSLGASVDVQYSGEDAAMQLSQAENLILKGVKTLVVVAYDGDAAAAIVEKAHAANVKVIAYDRMINKSDVDLYMTFDSRTIGKLETEEILRRVPKGKIAYIGGATTDNNAFLHKEGVMKVLDPLIKKGDIKLVVDSFTTDWRPEEAYKTMKQYLASGKTVDAVIAANDGTAGGVIQALKEYKLDGKVPVAGADADLIAVQRLLDGTQTATIYTPLNQLAQKAADAAVALAKGEVAGSNGTLNNGKIDVPSLFLDPILVTKETIDETVILGGFYTRDQVYKKK